MPAVRKQALVKPPSDLSLLMEGRAVLELGALPAALPLLRLAPRGSGPVLVLPGLMADDWSTAPLRWFLQERGYSASGWEQGTNLGYEPGRIERLKQRVLELKGRYQRKIRLIGWSMGGIYARQLARELPDDIRQIILLGSPFAAHQTHRPPPVPTTAIYSKSDGVVPWQVCMEPQPGEQVENIEIVGASHCGLGHHPAVLWCIANRLSQREGSWRPFKNTTLNQLFYGFSAPPFLPMRRRG